MALLARDQFVGIDQVVSGIAVVLERKDRPTVGEMTSRAIFRRPDLLELASMGIVVTAVALFKIFHLPDHGAMTTKTGDLSVFTGEGKSGFVVVEGLPLRSARRNSAPRTGGVAFLTFRTELSFVGIDMAVGTLGES